MESYFEITLFHNCCVDIFCLYLAHACSFCEVSKKQILACLALVVLRTYLFHPYSMIFLVFVEVMVLMRVYRHCEFLFFLMLGFRWTVNLYFFYTVDGSIYNGQFFIAGETFLWIEWSVLSVFIISLYVKGRIELLEHFFVRVCYVEKKQCLGYLDSGNFLFVQGIPVIFLNQALFDTVEGIATQVCEVVTVNGNEEKLGKKCHFSYDQKHWKEVICLPMENQKYDCLINMKGLRT